MNTMSKQLMLVGGIALVLTGILFMWTSILLGGVFLFLAGILWE